MHRRHRPLVTAAILLTTTALLAQAPQQPSSADDVRARYTKYQYMVPMRDGVRLFTSIYTPKDTSQKYPFLITRTPYSVGPYGVDQYRTHSAPRSTSRSPATSSCTRTPAAATCPKGNSSRSVLMSDKQSNKDVDESTDTYDTIEWLLKNVPNNNGRVGMVGISQPGFHVAGEHHQLTSRAEGRVAAGADG